MDGTQLGSLGQPDAVQYGVLLAASHHAEPVSMQSAGHWRSCRCSEVQHVATKPGWHVGRSMPPLQDGGADISASIAASPANGPSGAVDLRGAEQAMSATDRRASRITAVCASVASPQYERAFSV